MSPQRAREWILIVTRDILAPTAGVFLAIYLPLSHQFEVWQGPLIISLIGIPIVAPRDPKDPSP